MRNHESIRVIYLWEWWSNKEGYVDRKWWRGGENHQSIITPTDLITIMISSNNLYSHLTCQQASSDEGDERKDDSILIWRWNIHKFERWGVGW